MTVGADDALATLSADDAETLRAWLATFGDGARPRAVTARVRLLLSLRAMHPTPLTLDALLDVPEARAVLCASPEGRRGELQRYRAWCARRRRDP